MRNRPFIVEVQHIKNFAMSNFRIESSIDEICACKIKINCNLVNIGQNQSESPLEGIFLSTKRCSSQKLHFGEYQINMWNPNQEN